MLFPLAPLCFSKSRLQGSPVLVLAGGSFSPSEAHGCCQLPLAGVDTFSLGQGEPLPGGQAYAFIMSHHLLEPGTQAF